MGISTEAVYLLDRMNAIASKVGLGTLIKNAEGSGDLPLADAKILVGGADGLAHAQTPSGDVTMSNAGVTAIGAGKVTKAMLAAGVSAPLMVVAAGEFTTAGGDANEQIAAAGVLGTDTVVAHIRKPGAVAVTLDTITPGADVIDLVFSGDPAADHIVGYIVLRATT